MSTALYRRYRPETFADVIGQEHVTDPLMAAIDKDRINHAYLFSGPRGCGKTTSARILARCLNCAQGPTSTPCGTCDSCVELARNGSGSLDVIEIDAASHGGVDDARDLRERATFAPVRDRFKIFIIDEAHMVTSAGFNALLKIVEEPPEHILFIFATTEPDKVIGTIRSRTHHYPFRLVPPEPLLAYLEQLCRQENVPVAPGVLSLVIRAGGGSVRDSLSVLDQLMAGAGEGGLDYELAVSLLGYTHATLLDDVVDSVAAGDAATVFHAVDRVIQTGHDPRRFVEDLLERFRDLIVINAVPEGAASILRGVPDDQLNRMRTQANQLGAGELSRSADVTNTALTEMTGATSPRLHLELLCARLLLPAADATVRGTLARVDRIERRLEYAAGTPAPETPEVDDAPKAPDRPRLDVPRTAEEAAARWSLPSADPVAPAAPAAVPGASSPAVPAAARTRPPAGSPTGTDSSPDWGASWGVATNSAFSDPEPDPQPVEPPAARPAGPIAAPGEQAGQPPVTAAERPSPRPDAAPRTPDPQPAVAPEQPPARTAHPASQPPSAGGPQPGPEQDRSADRTQEQPPSGTAGTDQDGQGQPGVSGGNVEMIRRAWPEIMDEVARIKRATWLIVNVTAKPRSFEGNQLVLAFTNQGNAIGFQRGPHMDNLKRAISTVLGLTCSIEPVHDAGGSGESGPKVPAAQAAPGSNPGPGAPAPTGGGPRVPSDGGVQGVGSASRSLPVQAGTAGAGSGAPTVETGPAGGPGTTPSAPAVSAGPGSAPAAATPSRPSEVPSAPGTPRSGPSGSTSAAVEVGTAGSGPTARRGAVRGPADVEATARESVEAWNPAMSDDSWALVEPPEEAFDPGPGWSPPPGAPEDRRIPGPSSSPHPGPGSDPDTSGAPPAPASRSVVWSPPAATTAQSGGAARTAPAVPVGGTGSRGATPPEPAAERGTGAPTAPAPDRPASAGNVRQKPVSRYQQLLDEAERKRAEEAAATRGTAALRIVEDEPSADDETIEESGLVGRTAIERILNGRLIEERSVDSQ